MCLKTYVDGLTKTEVSEKAMLQASGYEGEIFSILHFVCYPPLVTLKGATGMMSSCCTF